MGMQKLLFWIDYFEFYLNQIKSGLSASYENIEKIL